MNIPDLSFSGDFTMAAWVNLSGTINNADAVMGQEGSGADLNFYASRFRYYTGSGDAIVANTSISASTWAHVVLKRSGTALTIYINGVQDSASGTLSAAFAPKAIGRGNAGYLGGLIDEVYLYDYALSGAEITTLYNDASGSPEINVQGNAVTIADGDTTPSTTDHTDFGSTDVTSGTVTRTFTIQNTGTVSLSVSSVTLSGTHAADFSVTAQPASSVATSGSTTFQVQFNPSATGVRTASLSFANGDANENPYNFSIQGTGTSSGTPEINVQGNSVTIADGDTTPSTADHTDFGSTDVTSGTVTRSFTIQNTGTASLSVSSVTLSGTHAADFSVTAQPASSVAASGSTTFQVQFNPSATGVRTASLSFANGDTDENPYNFSIQGNGSSVPTTGLVAYWNFNESSGTTASDSSGNGYHGTLTDGGSFVAGRKGNAVSLDGSNDWVNIPDLTLPGDFTVAGWVKLPVNLSAADVLMGQEGFGVNLNFLSSRFRFNKAAGDAIIANTTIALDTWAHVAVKRSGTAFTIYINGVQDSATGSWSGDFPPKTIGRGTGGYLQGLIDELYLYDRALSTTEIQTLYNDAP